MTDQNSKKVSDEHKMIHVEAAKVKTEPLRSQGTVPVDLTLSHDLFFKEVFKMVDIASAFLKKVLPKETVALLDFEKLTVAPDDFITSHFNMKYADIVYTVPLLNENRAVAIYIVLEHKSYNDRFGIFQLTSYTMQIHERNMLDAVKKGLKNESLELSAIFPVLFHHGSSKFTKPTELKELYHPVPGAEPYQLNMKAIMFDLSTISYDEIPCDPDVPALEVILQLMKAVYDPEINNRLEAIMSKMEPYINMPAYKRLIHLMINYVQSNTDFLTNNVIKHLYLTFYTEEERKTMPTLVEQAYSRGLEQGIEQGIGQGIGQGWIKKTISMIKRALLSRFNWEIPVELEECLYQITDSKFLDELLDKVYEVHSVAEFVSLIPQSKCQE